MSQTPALESSPTPVSRKPIKNFNMNSGHNSGDEDIPERKSEYETQSLLNAPSNMKLHQRYSGHISAKEL